MVNGSTEQQTTPPRKMTPKGLVAIILLICSLLPLKVKAGAGLGILYNQTFQTNEINITSDLWLNNDSVLPSSEASFWQQNIPANLLDRGCFDLGSTIKQWEYHSVGEDESLMVTNHLGWLIRPGNNDHFLYTVPTNQLVGWEAVTAEMVALNEGAVPFTYIVPLTLLTKTANGAALGVLVDANLATNGSSRAEFEAASSNNWNNGPYLDWQKFLIGGSTNYTGGFDASIALTNGNSSISWSPTVSNRIYDVCSKTNLFDAAWIKSGAVTNDSGSIDSYGFTNDLPSAFYKIDISLP